MASQGDFRDLLGKPVPFHGKGNALVTGGIEGYVATAARPGCVGVLVLLDADKEPACEEGPMFLGRGASTIAQPVVVALAERDYEDWLYASVETLSLGEDAAYVEGANGGAQLARLLGPTPYIKPTWQPRLSARVDLDLARGRSTSLNRMLNKFDDLRELIA